jgi:amino acid transporter
MGIAGTAPAFSLAATTATLTAAVGLLSVGSLLYCGLVMFGVALAFLHLNKVITNAGASYAWVRDAFGPTLGFFAGWAVLVASAVFMVSATVPAATATLMLVAPSHADHPPTVALVAAGWLLAASAVIVKGIKPTSYTQVVMTVIDVGVLAVIVVAAMVQGAAHPAQAISWHDLSLFRFTPETFATGALTSLFFFWGWDVTLNLNEETRNGAHSSGRGAIIAMVVVLLLFAAFVAACQMVLTDQEIEQAGTNVVFALAEHLFPRPWSYCAVIAVMLSTVGTLETSLLQFSRTMYAKARDGALHPRFAMLHQSWQTPWLATLTITVIGLVLLFGAASVPTIGEIMQDSVRAISFQVACYYGLTGIACAWRFRATAWTSPVNALLLFLWPLGSALFLVFIALYSIPTFDLLTNVVGIGGLLIGFVPLAINRQRRARALAG